MPLISELVKKRDKEQKRSDFYVKIINTGFKLRFTEMLVRTIVPKIERFETSMSDK